jgi:hypothetical protein
MSTISHPPTVTGRHAWVDQLRIREMWVSLAITAMWLAVAVDAVWGPDMVFHSGSGGGVESSSTVPSAVAVAFFAFLGSWVVARYGLGRPREDTR